MSHYRPNIFILLGPPGSGKGTQAKRLAQKLALPHISTGDLFRQNIAFETELGLRVKELIHAGHLVPDSIVEAMLFDRIKESDCKHGYILDGFPRTIVQADSYHQHTQPLNPSTYVLELYVPDEVIIQRASGRVTCQECASVYNRNSSALIESCEKCGGKLFQRPDDRPEVVKERLQVYARQTEPLIKYYTEKGLLTKFNGDQLPEKVFADLVDFLHLTIPSIHL